MSAVNLSDAEKELVRKKYYDAYNVYMSKKITEQYISEKFGDAHEQRLDNPADRKKMDLHNNALGRRIAIEYAGQGYDVFSKKIIDAIINGEAEVIIWDPCVK